MKKAMLSSFEIDEEDKAWLTSRANGIIGASVNSILRGLIKEARLRDERKKK
jgi:hypothetical protein